MLPCKIHGTSTWKESIEVQWYTEITLVSSFDKINCVRETSKYTYIKSQLYYVLRVMIYR